MKDKYIKFEDLKKEMLKDPKAREAYKRAEAKYAVIKAILDARYKKGVTQAELAKKMGTKQSAIARLESGSYNPTIEFLNKLADALDKNLVISFK